MKDLHHNLSCQNNKEIETSLKSPTNQCKLEHLDAVESNFEALLGKAKKVDSKVEDDIMHLIEEGKKIHPKEKLNILANDCYGYEDVEFFEGDDLLTNSKYFKKLCKALKLAIVATKREKRGNLELKVIQISLNLNLISP